MNLFQIKTQPLGIERKDLFLTEGVICIGYPNTGDLTNVDKDEIREILRRASGWESSQLGNHLGIVNAFVHTMAEGDTVLIADQDWVHIGEVGPYQFDATLDESGLSHRRPVRWLGRVERHRLNEYVRELLRNRGILSKFKHPYDIAELDRILRPGNQPPTSNEAFSMTIREAIEVLKNALRADDQTIRVRAASALLAYFK